MDVPGDIYQRLPDDQDTIRLLQLEPAEYVASELRCTLISTKLSEGCKFEAVSYTWGAPLPSQKVLIAGQAVDIGQNLYDCLEQLRDIKETRVLWVDALSINQKDDREKGHQVNLMAKIFTAAESVLVWLGRHADGSWELFVFINELQASVSSSFRTPQPMVRAKSKLFERPYWSRTWVIQELFMARNLVFYCGSSEVDEEHFRRLLRELSAMGPLSDDDQQALLLATARRIDTTGWGQYSLGRSLAQLISVYWKTDCSNPRDKVYALLGLVRKTDRAKSLEVDYSVTTSELYYRVLDLMDDLVEADRLRKGLRLRWPEILLANSRPKQLQGRRINDEGLLLDVRASPLPDNARSNMIYLSTQAPSDVDRVWVSACGAEPGDKCYSLGHRQLAFVFRRQAEEFVFVGPACACLPDGLSLSEDLSELQDLLMDKNIYSGSRWGPVGSVGHRNVELWTLLAAAIDSYSSGRSEAEARWRLLEKTRPTKPLLGRPPLPW